MNDIASQSRFTLRVVRVVVEKMNEKNVFTDQWAAVVYDGKRKAYTSNGYHYATEARQAGIHWINGAENR